MNEITLEKVDLVKERAFVTYLEAKEALEHANGDVLEALIYIEKNQKERYEEEISFEEAAVESETISDFKEWIKGLIKMGTVSRIKVKRDDRVLIDVPVNAGLAAGVIAVLMPQILAIGVVTAVATKLTIEIQKTDGSVEVVNKVIKNVARDFSRKVKVVADDVKDMAQERAQDIKDVVAEKKNHMSMDKSNIDYKMDNESNYTYTVRFDENDNE